MSADDDLELVAGVDGCPISPAVARLVDAARVALLEERQRENAVLRAKLEAFRTENEALRGAAVDKHGGHE
jgi:hypothetical protein